MLESEELENREVDGGVEPKATLVRAQSRVVLRKDILFRFLHSGGGDTIGYTPEHGIRG